MKAQPTVARTIDEYITGFPKDVQAKLKKIRATIRKSAPDAEETISYHMPAFKLNGILVWFAAFKKHIGFYPIPTGINKFEKELAHFKQGKGSVRFPLDASIPYGLISRIVKFRMRENLARAEKGKK